MREQAISVAKAAGAILRAGLSSTRTIERKSAAIDVVTDIDLASEKAILQGLREHFPGHRILTEEAGDDAVASEYCWIVDPLDGTTNYAHGYPAFCVSLGLLVGGAPTLGVVYDPIADECFVAEKGRGAFLNDRALAVTKISALDEALVSTGFPYDLRTNPRNNVAEMNRIILEVMGVRRSGSAAIDLCYVAAGRTEAHWEMGLKPWDTAAGALIITEAGGQVSDWANQPWTPFMPFVLASNGHVHAALSALLSPANNDAG